MPRHTALIAGASGFIGRRIADHLLAQGGWDVIGLARRPPPTHDLLWIAVDLSDAADCRRALSGLDAVTHVFYAARYDHPVEGQPDPVPTNAEMLENLVDVLEPVAGL